MGSALEKGGCSQVSPLRPDRAWSVQMPNGATIGGGALPGGAQAAAASPTASSEGGSQMAQQFVLSPPDPSSGPLQAST